MTGSPHHPGPILWRLAARQIWKARGALLLQLVSLAIAVATLMATEQLRQQTLTSPVAGAPCADGAATLAGEFGGHHVEELWTLRQANALAQALGATPVARVYVATTSADAGDYRERIDTAFVDPAYFQMLCVPRRNALGQPAEGPFDQGAVLDADLAKKLGHPRELRTRASAISITHTSHGFHGLEDRRQPVSAWLPLQRLLDESGPDLFTRDVHIVRVVAKLPSGPAAAKVLADASEQLKRLPGTFPGLVKLQPALNTPLTPQSAEKIRLLTILLRVIAWALLAMATLNLVIYHWSRGVATTATVTTLVSVGVPPGPIRWFLALEPLGVAAAALVVGGSLSTPLANRAAAIVTPDQITASWAAPWLAAIAVCCVFGGLGVLARHYVSGRGAGQTKARGTRTLVHVLPFVVAAQIALAVVTLGVGAQAAIGLFKALPPAPAFNLRGLSLVGFTQPEGAAEQHNLQRRWQAVVERMSLPGYQAALAATPSPFLPAGGWVGNVGIGGQSVPCIFNEVTGNFFDVIGVPVPNAHAFLAAPDNKYPATVVLSRPLAEQLLGHHPEPGTIVRTNVATHAVAPGDPAAVVAGVFDSGIIGARGAQGHASLEAMASSQAALPVVYRPMTTLRAGEPFMLFVRHPENVSPAQAAGAMLPMVQTIAPDASIEDVDSAENYYRYPLLRERAMALVLGCLSVASITIGLLGLLALLTIIANSLKIEMAVRYAVGASRMQAIGLLLRRVAPHVGIGIAIALVPQYLAIAIMGDVIPLSRAAGLWGSVIAVSTVLLACAVSLSNSILRVRRAHFMDWLRID